MNKTTAYQMVKRLLDSGVAMKNIGRGMRDQMTTSERAELGFCLACTSDDLNDEDYGVRCLTCGAVFDFDQYPER